MAGFGLSRPLGPPGGRGPPLSFSLESRVCPLCLSSHDEWITLYCGHFFCKNCLTSRRDGNMIICPSCNKRMDLGDHGLDGLQSNYLISNILDIVTSPDDVRTGSSEQSIFQTQWTSSITQPLASPICHLCSDNLKAAKFCAECQDYLCSNCVAAHHRVKLTSEHRLISAQFPIANSSEYQLCSKHSNEVLGYWCKTCVQPVCRECLHSLEHGGHSIIHIHEAAEEMRTSLPAIINDIKAKGNSLNTFITQVDVTLESVDSRSKTVASEVKTCVRQNIKALEEKERELLKQVESVRKLKSEILQSQKEELLALKTQLDETAALAVTAYQTSSDTDLVYIRQNLQLAISKIQGEMIRLSNCHDDDQIGFSQRDHALKNSISQMGAISSSVSSVHTTACGHGTYCAIIGKCAKFLVTCRNHVNQKIIQPIDSLDVSLLDPEGKPQPIELAGKHDGVFQFSYYPALTGVYTISVLLRGRHITGSPMKAKVRKRRNYFNIGSSHHKIGTDGDREGQLCRPWGVCCDPQGHIIVADRSNNRVQVFNPDGTYKHMFGRTGTQPGQFNRPAGVAVNSRNNIIVTDKDNHRVQIFGFDGNFLHMFGERGSLNGQLHYPWDVACNNEDMILVSDTRNHRIQLFSPDGHYLNKFTFHAPPHQRVQLPQPRGVCFTESGDILVTDFNKHRLMFIKSNFQSIQSFGNEGQGSGQFFRPQGVTVDLEGNILVSEGRNNRVQIFRPDGTFLAKFGSLGTGDNEFDRPSGITVTPEGYIVVVDFGNNRILYF